MGQKLDINPVIDGIAGRSLPGSVQAASLAMMAWGIAGLGYGFTMAQGGAAWTLGAVLVAIVYAFGIAQGGIMFSVIQTGTWARWGRPLKRIAEAFGFFLPVAYLLLLVFLLVGIDVYAWSPTTIIEGGPVALEPHSKEAFVSKPYWLTKGFFIGRQVVGFGLLIFLDVLYLRHSLRPDLVLASRRLAGKAPAWWRSLTGGSDDLEGALASGLGGQTRLFPFIAITYAFVFSMLAFDLVMSLSPWWFSNMFGGWIFMSSIWLALATLAVVSMLGRDWLNLGGFIKTNVTHDLGKLMLAGCMFWAYTTYAQLLPIWYTDMPEETDYVMVRLYLPQWSWLAQTVAITCFVAPFTILLSRGIKKMRYPFAGVGLLIMVGLFLERSLLVMPSVYFGDTFPMVDFLVVNVGVWLGVLGLMIQVVGRILAQIPPLVISDPHLETHPWEVHVHSLDHAHHH